MARVLIADDHAMIRAGLRQWLEQDRSVEAVAEAASGAETLQQLRDGSWDLVVLDINMPDRSGIDILRHIRSGHPETRVLVISGFSEKQYAIYALRAGASGYLAKDQAPEEFMRAVHTVVAGRRFASAALTEMLVNALDEPADRPLHAAPSQWAAACPRSPTSCASVSRPSAPTAPACWRRCISRPTPTSPPMHCATGWCSRWQRPVGMR